jgi:YidC/Oxa1 family membrane protein insertase
MIDKRSFLYLMLALLGFLLWNQWQMDHAPAVEPKVAVATSSTPGATTSASNDLPPAAAVAAQQGTSATKTAPGVAQASTGHGELVTITTDTLKLVIDTKGGNIHKASLPKYLKEVDKPDVPVQIFSDSP